MRAFLGFVAAGIVAAGAAGNAPAQTTSEAAVDVAYAVASDGAVRCGVTVDRAQSFATQTPLLEVTDQRPAGYDVVVRGMQGVAGSFESRWLVADGRAYPQNIAAARLAGDCRSEDIRPKTVLDWHRLPYLDPTTGEIEIGSNAAWSGASEISSLQRYTGSGVRLRDPMEPIWGRRCSAGAQTVRFSRDVFLLGPPEQLRMVLANVSRGQRRWPFASWSISINGWRLFYKTEPGTAVGSLTAKGLKLIRFGANRIEVTVRKRATGSCDQSHPTHKIGVLLSISGEQAWHLHATRPGAVQHVTPTSPADFAIPHTIGNDGPSVLLEPVFVARVRVTQSTLKPWAFGPIVTSTSNYETSDPGCRNYQDAAEETWQTICGMAPMLPGERRSFQVMTMVGRDPVVAPLGTPYLVSWQAEWQFGGLSDSVASWNCSPPAGQNDCSALGR